MRATRLAERGPLLAALPERRPRSSSRPSRSRWSCPMPPAAMSTSARACCRAASATHSASRSSSRTGPAPAAPSPATYVARSAPDGHTLFVGSNGPIMLGPDDHAEAALSVGSGVRAGQLARLRHQHAAGAARPAGQVGGRACGLRQEESRQAHARHIERRQHQSFHGGTAEARRPASPGPRCTIAAMRRRSTTSSPAMSTSASSSSRICCSTSRPASCARSRCSGRSASPALPDVPTIAEAGFPDVQGVTFNGVFAPKATPPADRRAAERRRSSAALRNKPR